MSLPEPTDTKAALSEYRLAVQHAGEELAKTAPEASVRDNVLIEGSLGGDFGAFESLVARYERRAFWVAFHVVGRVEDARDTVQEAFVRVHRSLDQFDFAKSFYTWLYRIVTNLAIDRLRKNRSARTVQLDGGADDIEQGDAPFPGQRLEGRELAGRVRDTLDRLPARFRTVLTLRDLHQISCREIAPILGLTYTTVRWRLNKARQMFRERWAVSTRTRTE